MREFLRNSAAVMASGALPHAGNLVGDEGPVQSSPGSAAQFAAHQEQRRKELWGMSGDLPWQHRPGAPKLVKTEKHDGYTLERLVLDLNGQEPVPRCCLFRISVRHRLRACYTSTGTPECMASAKNNF